MSDPVRIAVACSANNEDLESMLVLDYSLKKHSSLDVDITWMRLSRDPNDLFYSDNGEGWDTHMWATPFTGFRWATPALGRRKGFSKMIYFDSDFVVQKDIAGLWYQQFKSGQSIIAKPGPGIRYCCSMWDCQDGYDVGQFWGDPQVHNRMTRIYEKANKVQAFANGDWNVLDLMLPDPISPNLNAIHYTRVDCQLQLKHCLPRLEREGISHWYKGSVHPHPRQDLQKLFDDLYAEALSNGYHLDDYRTEPYGKYDLRGK